MCLFQFKRLIKRKRYYDFKKNIKFEYRNNDLSEDLIFLSATFKGINIDANIIKDQMFKLIEKRKISTYQN